MNLISSLFGNASAARAISWQGEATVRSKEGLPSTTITVGVRLIQDGRRSLGTKLEHPFLTELEDELISFYKRKKFSLKKTNLLRTFDGYAIDGVARAGRTVKRATGAHLRALTAVFTKFEGAHLRIGWGQGVILATGLACLNALGEAQQFSKLQLNKWEEV